MTDRELIKELVSVWDNRVRWNLPVVVEKMREQLKESDEREKCARICDRVAGYEQATGKVTSEELPWAAFCASLIRGNKVNA